METEASILTPRYTSIVGAFLKGIAMHRHVLPNWLAAEFDKLFKRTYMKALVLLSKLMAGTYRLPRKRTTKRPPQPPKPPIFTPPDQPKTTGWMWFARLLPSNCCPSPA
jgi:hypothetical protein